METNTYIEVIRRKSAAFTEAASRVSFDTTVPSCPGWRMRELVSHLGQAQEWSRQMVETRARERLPFQESRPVIEDDRLLSWFADQTVLLISALEGTDPAIPIWNWTGRGVGILGAAAGARSGRSLLGCPSGSWQPEADRPPTCRRRS